MAKQFQILRAISISPDLQGRLELKGGTALNLFLLDLPRLSVDLDLNVVGPPVRGMGSDEEWGWLKTHVGAVLRAAGVEARAFQRTTHGGELRGEFEGRGRRRHGVLIELLHHYRVSLFDSAPRRPVLLEHHLPSGARIVSTPELIAGKILALASRCKARDAYDVARIDALARSFEPEIQLALVVFSCRSENVDLRTFTSDQVSVDPRSVDRELSPVLRARELPEAKAVGRWTAALDDSARRVLQRYVRLAPTHREFLERLYTNGEIRPELLTAEERLQALIRKHPCILWRQRRARG